MDEARREAISQELYARRKAEIGDAVAHVGEDEETEDEDLIGYDAIEPGLPPASSDRQKWWLDNKQPAQAQIPIPYGADGQPMALNPNRPANPFGHTDEPDWISVPRSSSMASLTSISSSPYESVNLPRTFSASTTGTIPRKLPPPYDPSNLPARVGRMTLGDERTGRSNVDLMSSSPPPPPPPRRPTGGMSTTPTQALPPPLRPTSAASQLSQLSQQKSGKPAPPVAKKPAHLTSTSPTISPGRGSGFKSDGDHFQPALPPRSMTADVGRSARPNGPGVLRKAVTSSGSPASAAGGVMLPGMSQRASGPGDLRPVGRGGPPPSSSRPKPGSVDLLDSLDEGGHEMGGWETLKPSAS